MHPGLRYKQDMGAHLAWLDETPLDEIPPGEDAREARWEQLLKAREQLNALIKDERERGGDAWAAFVARRAR
jgi:hypothetical protein